jgi:hypothetical protein
VLLLLVELLKSMTQDCLGWRRILTGKLPELFSHVRRAVLLFLMCSLILSISLRILEWRAAFVAAEALSITGTAHIAQQKLVGNGGVSNACIFATWSDVSIIILVWVIKGRPRIALIGGNNEACGRALPCQVGEVKLESY